MPQMADWQDDAIREMQSLLGEIEALAPTRETTISRTVLYRTVSGDDLIEDSLPEDSHVDDENAPDLATDDDESIGPADSQADQQFTDLPARSFEPTSAVPLAAVDCGIARIGETEDGIVIALRATIVIDAGESSRVKLFRSGPIYLRNRTKEQLFYVMGTQLGRPDFYVEIDKTAGGAEGTPTVRRLKQGVADDAHRFADRFRNWFERLIQRYAVGSIQNGIVVLDGALTLRTRDTPAIFLRELGRRAAEQGNSILAISKQSDLQVDGRTVRFWLSDVPNRPCYRLLSGLMRREGAARSLGNVYAVRFSATGPTFRMDVRAAEGQSDDECTGAFSASALMRGGYPDLLVRAHAYSYFTSPAVVQLQSQAGARYALTAHREIDLSPIFGPFGGRFK